MVEAELDEFCLKLARVDANLIAGRRDFSVSEYVSQIKSIEVRYSNCFS